jgi:hypothetical protein
MYFLDYATLGGLCIVYYNMMKERKIAQEAMQAIDNQAESIPRFLEIANLRKCINPMWVSNDVILHSNSKVLHFYHYL